MSALADNSTVSRFEGEETGGAGDEALHETSIAVWKGGACAHSHYMFD